MKKELLVEGLAPPISHYCDAVRFGDLLFIAGIPPTDRSGKVMGGDDVAAQTRQVFRNMKLVLDAAGASFADILKVTVYLLASDEKRIHTFEELRHATEGWISATSENITLHIDMNARKVAPFPADIQARIRDVVASNAGLPRPEGTGRKVAMPSK